MPVTPSTSSRCQYFTMTSRYRHTAQNWKGSNKTAMPNQRTNVIPNGGMMSPNTLMSSRLDAKHIAVPIMLAYPSKSAFRDGCSTPVGVMAAPWFGRALLGAFPGRTR